MNYLLYETESILRR